MTASNRRLWKSAPRHASAASCRSRAASAALPGVRGHEAEFAVCKVLPLVAGGSVRGVAVPVAAGGVCGASAAWVRGTRRRVIRVAWQHDTIRKLFCRLANRYKEIFPLTACVGDGMLLCSCR